MALRGNVFKLSGVTVFRLVDSDAYYFVYSDSEETCILIGDSLDVDGVFYNISLEEVKAIYNFELEVSNSADEDRADYPVPDDDDVYFAFLQDEGIIDDGVVFETGYHMSDTEIIRTLTSILIMGDD